MSWLSSIGNAIGSVAKSAVKVAGSVAKTVLPSVASFAVGLVPGVGPLLSKGVDVLGNALMGNSADPTTDGGTATPVLDMMASASATMSQMNAANMTALGTSPAASALASNFLGIGGSAPGVFGIGDGKPGVFGIGTGKNAARQQAEDAAKGEGLSPKQVKLAGDEAAAKHDEAAGGSSVNPMLIAGGVLLALLAL